MGRVVSAQAIVFSRACVRWQITGRREHASEGGRQQCQQRWRGQEAAA